MRIGVLAGSEWCIPLLVTLRNSGIEVRLFAEVDDRSTFAGVQQFCASAGIEIQEAEGNPDRLYAWLDYWTPDALFIVGYKHLVNIHQLPARLITSSFNIHFGSLPDFRGPNPVFWQLKNGNRSIGVSIHRLTMQFDRGDVVWCKDVARRDYFTYGFTNRLCSQLVIEGVIYILNGIMRGQDLPPVFRQASSAYYKRPQLEDVMIDWQKMTATQILNLVNACNPWNKGAITFIQRMEVKILDATIANENALPADILPGTILNMGEAVAVSSMDKKILNVHFFTINGIFVPARLLGHYGISDGCFSALPVPAT